MDSDYSLQTDGPGAKNGHASTGDTSIRLDNAGGPASRTNRLVDREDVQFLRSKGRWNIKRQKVPQYWRLYLQDPFHSLVNMRLSKVILALLLLYVAVLCFFAALYTTVQKRCDAGIDSYFDGFSFSVSVFFTIGFGTGGDDVFFHECAWVQTIITVESLLGVLMDALAFGVVFQRVSRAQGRANTVVMSNKACVRRHRNDLYFTFQTCEMRKHQLVEAHVRVYVIRHDLAFGPQYYFQSYPMRLQHPDDELGGMLLLALPSLVVHRMDTSSPLMPIAENCPVHPNPTVGYLYPDRDQNHDNHCICDSDGKAWKSEQELRAFWEEAQVEVAVLIEGIDAVTSSSIQVRHSYKSEDILFDRRFASCVSVDKTTGGAIVDFTKFHDTEELEASCAKVNGRA